MRRARPLSAPNCAMTIARSSYRRDSVLFWPKSRPPRTGSADLALIDACGCRGVVRVVAPGWVGEVDNEVAVIGRDGIVERHSADAGPVGEGTALQKVGAAG